ncbi:ANR family transcriptional regulator [Otariodibacter oris]|uniref:ANR family transcriptional regulator n=1 Tax=Otariodibacter oris TaxID=1032623 RepID=A0A420XIQ5_9PAST|nr:ANR family transcriptional regulator [Otariodibacter oris]QGM80689.1 hypothetical protein A6A10_04355 [Otariodibacter oris]RKR77149.1 hypothetical protein DES31_0474 [Otariodibacter oris]
MKKPMVLSESARFKYATEGAAYAERKGDYKEASNKWNYASKLAPNEANKEWCVHRCDFCERLTIRSF